MSEIEEAIERLEEDVSTAKKERNGFCKLALASDIQTVCQALREALKDKGRLDWLEQNGNVDLAYSAEGGFYFTDSYGAGEVYPTIRQAIDAAMTPTPPVKQ